MEVQVMTNVLEKNDAIANSLKELFEKNNIYVFNII